MTHGNEGNESAPGANQGRDQYTLTISKSTSNGEEKHQISLKIDNGLRIVPQATGIPVVIPEKITQGKTTRGVTVLCPFCDRLHSHGWPFDEHEIGLRAPDCSGHGYVIATPAGGVR
jgi:hypothetical protein